MQKPTLIEQPSRVISVGNKPKLIDEFIGRVNTRSDAVSVARMQSPSGWEEPGQTPDFDEFTVVTKGVLQVEFEGGTLLVRGGQAVIAHKGAWVRYSTPRPKGPSISPSASRLSRRKLYTGIANSSRKARCYSSDWRHSFAILLP